MLSEEDPAHFPEIKGVDEAESELKRWLWLASQSGISAFRELYKKIKCHKEHILNFMRLAVSNARTGATNNMLDMVYLVCADLKVPLPNQNLKSLKLNNWGCARFLPLIPLKIHIVLHFSLLKCLPLLGGFGIYTVLPMRVC